MSGRLTASLYLAAWRIAPRLPIGVVRGFSGIVADLAWLSRGRQVRRLEDNHARLLGRRPTRTEARAAVRSHMRNYAEQFALGGFTREQIAAVLRMDPPDLLRTLGADGPVVLALTHSGNWDLGGADVAQNVMPILTVAERLDPPGLFDAFVAFREGLGMEIIGAGRGESVFPQLVERARGRSVVVPLLADRDVTGAGIEVDLCGHRALVAAGPAALAERLGRPLVTGVLHYVDEPGGATLALELRGPVPAPGPTATHTGVETHTQAWVDAVAPLMREYVRDWHMMQPVFVEDLDPERLARARERHRRKEQEEAERP